MHKKIHKLSYLSILFATLMLFSCNRADRKIYKIVPDNAAFVASFSPGKLLEKSKAKDLDVIKEALGKEEFNKILFENPGLSGINISSNSCVFMSGNDPKYLGLVMPVKNKKVFELFLENLGKQFNEEFIKEEGANFTYSKKANLILAWNSSVLIYLTQVKGSDESSTMDKMTELFSLKAENCILSDRDFKSFLSEQKDLNLWVTSNQIGSLTDTNMGMLNMLGAVNNNYAHFSLDFQVGAVVLSSNLMLNPDFKKSIDKFNFIDQDAERDILKMLPAEDLILAGNFRLNPEKILGIIDFFGSGNQQFLEEFEKETGTKPEEILKSIQGSLAFSINGITSVNPDPSKQDEKLCKKNIPIIVAAIRLNDDKILKDLLDLIKQKEPVIEKNGYYVINNEEVPFYLLVNKGIILLSNQEKYVNEIISTGKVNNNLESHEISKNLVKNPICIFLNLDRDSYSDKVKNYFGEEMDNSFAKGMGNFGASLKSLTINGGIEKTELRIELKDKSVNSLTALVKSIDHQ
jgi:hypothetical protein